MTIDELRRATALYARLSRLRELAPAVVPDEHKLEAFGLERQLKAMGVEVPTWTWPAPPEPTPPTTTAMRKAA